ncbi:MAG: COQ9 family protein, partial [Pseudomonadota bacterium]
RTAGAMWQILGDPSTDINFYTKRLTLSGVYLSTLARWFADEAGDDGEAPYAATWAFLDDRIENVMQFEKVKGRFQKGAPDRQRIAAFLGKLRYGSSA